MYYLSVNVILVYIRLPQLQRASDITYQTSRSLAVCYNRITLYLTRRFALKARKVCKGLCGQAGHRDSPLWAPAKVTFVKLMITFNISKFALIMAEDRVRKIEYESLALFIGNLICLFEQMVFPLLMCF